MASNPEEAVRRYLLHLEDPSKLVDEAKVAAAQAAVEQAKDPLDRLKALADLEHARQPDTQDVEQRLRRPRQGLRRQRVDPGLRVPGDGCARPTCWPGPASRCGPAAPPGTTASGAPRQRAPRVSLDTIKAAAVRLPRQFTLNDLAEKAGGGSQGTLRKAVDDLVAEGKVRKVGPMPNYRGRGRAPDPLRTGLTACRPSQRHQPSRWRTRSRSRRGPGLKSVPFVWATGMSAPCITFSGRPSSSAASCSLDEVQRGPAGAEATGPGREAEVPRRREQRAPDRGVQRDGSVLDPALDARDDVDRHLAHVLGEVGGRVDHPGLGLEVVGVLLGHPGDAPPRGRRRRAGSPPGTSRRASPACRRR